MCQATYTDELMGKRFSIWSPYHALGSNALFFHLTIASGKLQQKDYSHVLM